MHTNFEPQYQNALDDLISEWEPHSGEVIRTIDSCIDTVERIVKTKRPLGPDPRMSEDRYTLYRYFLIGSQWHVSIDLNHVDADRVIQHLGEQL